MEKGKGTVIFVNSKEENLGSLTMTFDDGSVETREVTSRGETIFNFSKFRYPVTLSIWNATVLLSDLPARVVFPDGERGTISSLPVEQGPFIIMCSTDDIVGKKKG